MTHNILNTGGPFLWFGNKHKLNKITLGTSKGGCHYTILINEYDRVLNIHKTIETATGKKYEQLFEISFFTFYRFVSLINKTMPSLIQMFQYVQKINIGKLRRHDLLLFPFFEDENAVKQFVNNKRSKRLHFKKEIPIDAIVSESLFPNEISNSNASFFLVASSKRGKCKNQGIIFKFTNGPQTGMLYFITKKNLAKYKRENARVIFNSIKQLNFKFKGEILKHMSEQFFQNENISSLIA